MVLKFNIQILWFNMLKSKLKLGWFWFTFKIFPNLENRKPKKKKNNCINPKLNRPKHQPARNRNPVALSVFHGHSSNF